MPFVAFYRLILFHFYVRGAFLYDSGLLGALMWHDLPALRLPPSLGGESFFVFHVAPVLWLVSAVSEVLPASMPRMFAGFVGFSHGLLALAVLWLLVSGFRMRGGWALLLAALAAVGFAFNGLAIAIARYPHFETFGAACLLMCLIALVLERHVVAVIAFAFALATREDFGLHACAFLAIWLVLNRLRRVPWRDDRWRLGFAVAGLAASAVALAAQHVAFPGHSSFARVYLGDPPYAHLTAALLWERALGWLYLHASIFLPAFAVVTWAAWVRNPYGALGYVACVPWAVLNFLAASEPAGWMVGYYAFPFLIAMAWPLLAHLVVQGRRPVPTRHGLAPAGGLLGLVLLSLLPIGRDYDPGRIPLPEAFLRSPSAAEQAATDAAVAALAAARPILGRLVVDNSVAALKPFAFARADIASWADGPADTVAYLADGFDAARLSPAPGLPARYRVPGTEVRIATNRPAAALRGLGVVPDPAP